MLELKASWVWDFWFADDGDRFHLFFLKASRALLDPDRRHLRASIGHAVSSDLVEWVEVADALVPADAPAYDDQATWTGSIVRDETGLWWMFYTGVSRAEAGLVQRVLAATSPDLMVWERATVGPIEADQRWYEQAESRLWPDLAWRDPWVFRGDAEWHMLVTARASSGDASARGVVGHATSPDLREWTVGPPLSEPDSGFGQLEVTQVAVVEGRPVLIFSCLNGELDLSRRGPGGPGGIWAVNAASVTGPFDVGSAYVLHGPSRYVGRLVQDRSGSWQLMAFDNENAAGAFVGRISDPMPVRWGPDGRLIVELGLPSR